TNLQDLLICAFVLPDEIRVFRPRAHEAHVAADHVPELRELVELHHRQDPADGREPQVVGARQRRPDRVDSHLPELQHLELTASVAEASAAEEDRAGAVELDQKRDCGEDWDDQEQDCDREAGLERPARQLRSAATVAWTAARRPRGARSVHLSPCLSLAVRRLYPASAIVSATARRKTFLRG